MDYFLQQLLNGLTLGMIYGLIAVGYTIVYGIIGMINVAHGDVFMVGAFMAMISLVLLSVLGVTSVPLALAVTFIVAVAFTALYGWVIERVAYRPLRGTYRIAPLISAIGISITLQNFVQTAQGARVKPIQPVLTGGVELVGGPASVSISYMQISVILTTAIVFAFFTWLVRSTKLGRAMRACEQDLKMASLVGINVNNVISLAFVVGAALAAIAGMMFLLYYGVIDFFIGFNAGTKAFTAAVLGGIGSIPGAVIGGVLIGLIETFWSAYVSVAFKDVAAFSILALTLIVLPTGLLGRQEVEKV